jgi:hypothetical protein
MFSCSICSDLIAPYEDASWLNQFRIREYLLICRPAVEILMNFIVYTDPDGVHISGVGSYKDISDRIGQHLLTIPYVGTRRTTIPCRRLGLQCLPRLWK